MAARDRQAASTIARRMEGRAVLLGADPAPFVTCPYPGNPRWRIDANWVEFECGCRAERCGKLHGQKRYDPVIFDGPPPLPPLPEQAVYDFVCYFHTPAMNKRVRFGGFATFGQWHRDRRRVLMGK